MALFSTRRFKQCGARYFADAADRLMTEARPLPAVPRRWPPDETDRA
jgi:hypothetical protein